MNISRPEQRVLHALAQGGSVRHERGDGRKITSILCVTRDGAILSDCTLDVFARLRRKQLIASRGGGPYRISRRGLDVVRAQATTAERGTAQPSTSSRTGPLVWPASMSSRACAASVKG